MNKKNYTQLTLILITLLILTSCDNNNSTNIIPKYDSPNDIQNFQLSFTEIIQSEKSHFRTISKSGFNNTERIKNNRIIIELINPKTFPISDKVLSQQINVIKEQAIKLIRNIDDFDEISLILKWTEKNIEKSKSIKI